MRTTRIMAAAIMVAGGLALHLAKAQNPDIGRTELTHHDFGDSVPSRNPSMRGRHLLRLNCRRGGAITRGFFFQTFSGLCIAHLASDLETQRRLGAKIGCVAHAFTPDLFVLARPE